jgi:hypothetical protein
MNFTNKNEKGYKRFKVFNDPRYREVISSALIDQVTKTGLARTHPILKYCLVAGKTRSDSDKKKIAALFLDKGWVFHDIDWIRERLKRLATSRYEDDITMMLAKIIQK